MVFSQAEVARRAGVSPTYLNQILKGKNESPSLKHLEAIARELRTTVAKLFAGPEDKPSVMDSIRIFRQLLQELESAEAADSPLFQQMMEAIASRKK